MKKQTTPSALTEEVSKKQRPKAGKGQANISWHRRPPGAQSGGAKEGQQRYLRGAKLELRRAAALGPKEIEFSRRSLCGLRSWAVGLCTLWGVFDLADRCKLDLKLWKRTIRNQGVNLGD